MNYVRRGITGDMQGTERSGDVDLGLAGLVAAIGSRAAVADVGILAALEAVIPVLTEEDVIALLPVKAIVSTTTDDAIVAITSAQVITTARAKDEVVGVGSSPVAGDDDDVGQVDPSAFRRFESIGSDGERIVIEPGSGNTVRGGEGRGSVDGDQRDQEESREA
ncbi:MAG: hypothetical protein V3T55_02650 [Anaerolineales bacterium]